MEQKAVLIINSCCITVLIKGPSLLWCHSILIWKALWTLGLITVKQATKAAKNGGHWYSKEMALALRERWWAEKWHINGKTVDKAITIILELFNLSEQFYGFLVLNHFKWLINLLNRSKIIWLLLTYLKVFFSKATRLHAKQDYVIKMHFSTHSYSAIQGPLGWVPCNSGTFKGMNNEHIVIREK